MDKVAGDIQKGMGKTFGGGGGGGLASGKPDEAVRSILGLPSAKKVISLWSKEAVSEMKAQGRRFKSLRYEAMQDLARHGSSQSAINQMGAIAMGDAKMWAGFKGYGQDKAFRQWATPSNPDWFNKMRFGGYKGSIPPLLSTIAAAKQKDMASFMANATFGMMPLMNPTSPWSLLFGTRQLFKGFSGTKTGQGIMGGLGLRGAGGAAAMTGGVVAGLMAVGIAIKGLIKVMHESIRAYQEAPKLYAKAMTSGLSLKFVTKRSMLAEIMGVSIEDVSRFGIQMQFLNPKIEWASSVLANTNRNLTSVGWSFKIVGNDFKAMFARIANDGAPALRKFLDGLHKIIITSTGFYDLISKQLGGKFMGALWSGMLGFPLSIGTDMGAAPAPLSFMKQLPASSWEKMGLVIGGGGGSNPAMQTAHNTKSMAQDMKKLVSYVARGGGAGTFNLQNAP